MMNEFKEKTGMENTDNSESLFNRLVGDVRVI